MKIIIDGIKKTYGRQYAVDKLNFQKKPGVPGTSGAKLTTTPTLPDLFNSGKKIITKAKYTGTIPV